MNQALMLSLMPMIQQLATLSAPMPIYIQLPTTATSTPSNRKEGNAKAPASFSGKDHTKLRDFLFKCELIFDMKPYTFATEKACVLYTVQHLDGMAKQHFRRYIEASGTDPKVTQWTAFTLELNSIFSDPDRAGKASGKLLALHMKETGHIHHFMVLFRELADELGWPNSILHQLYYNSLPNCIKDLWARTDPPTDLKQLI